MNWKLFLSVNLWVLLFFTACRKDEISFTEPTQKLGISSDTVILDTVYNQFRSATYVVKLFNQENKDIKIPKISLEQRANSQYKINVDGKAGHTFSNIPIRAKDSLFIFIEVAPNIKTKELLAEDKILIQSSFAQQQITLLSLVQDAEFFISTTDKPKVLTQDTHWDNSKVKIILGEIEVTEGKTLSIDKGTKVYFMQNSSLKINKNAKLNINGDLDQEVIFRGYRNEPRYDTLPKNWDKISLEEGSILNVNYAKIFGGTTGISLNHSTAKLKNTIIHTFQDYGISAVNSVLDAENLVINNIGIANLNILKGGKYSFTHSTLANYWNLSYNTALAIQAQNHWKNPSGKTETADLLFSFKNSIAYTKKSNAIKFDIQKTTNFQYLFENSLLKYHTDAGFIWENNPFITNSIKNEDPLFINTSASKMNLRLKENSPAKGKANLNTAQRVPLDIKKINRSNAPNIGAYQ